MGASSANSYSSLVREQQSLRRCFLSIHTDSMPNLAPSSNNHSHNANSQLERVRDVRASRRSRSPRGILDTPIPPRSRQTISLPISSDGMPSLPFCNCKSNDDQRQDERVETSPARRFQRRSSSPITAEVAQAMVTKLANEKRRERALNANKPVRRASREHHRGFRKDYIIGDSVRSHSHMITDPASSQAISALQKHDFAFIKRSDGSYSYSILAFRSFEPIRNGTGTEECMTFVTDGDGSSKTIRKKNWSKFVCPVSAQKRRSRNETSTRMTKATPQEEQAKMIPVFHQEVFESEDMLPGVISFDSTKLLDDECSLISSVLDGASALGRRS